MRAFLLFFLLIILTPIFAADKKEEWRLTTADVSLVTDNIQAVTNANTLLTELLKANNRSLWSMKEENGTILTIVISYQPIDQATSVKQVGFFRTFSLTIQRELEAQGIMYKPVQMKVAYIRDKPLIIKFFIKKTLLNVPPLVTKPN